MPEKVRLQGEQCEKEPTLSLERGIMEAVLNPLTSFESAAKVFEMAVTSVFVTSVVLLTRYVRK
jgi:hypothetical protein